MTITPFEMMLITSTILELNPVLQTIKIIKNKEARDVSIWTYVMILIIGVMWLVYSFQIESLPLIIGNGIKIFASVTVIVAYMRYRKGNVEA